MPRRLDTVATNIGLHTSYTRDITAICRTLLSGEYTQMAGRAGRRGLDTVGTVLLACWDEIPDEGEIKKLLTGKATKLESQFRLTYSMILNLLRVEDLKVQSLDISMLGSSNHVRVSPG